MSYSLNPHLPKVRRDAVLYADTHGIRAAARKYGYSPGAVCKWAKKARLVHGYSPIPTQTSRPHSPPHAIDKELAERITQERLQLKRCAEVVHKSLLNKGFTVSLSTVKRTLVGISPRSAVLGSVSVYLLNDQKHTSQGI